MNSNWKLLSAGLLVAALAGCGGGSSDDTTSPPELTPEEQCSEDGGIYEDGTCKSAEDLRNEGAEQEGEDRDAAEAAEAAQAMAKKLHGLLNPGDGVAAIAAPANLRIATYATQINDAEDGEYNKNDIHIVFMDTEGVGRQVDSVHTDGTTRPVANDVLILAANARHVMGSGFATGANQVLDHTDLKGEGDRTVQGSYMGAMGAYTCPTAADCTSQRTDNGIKLGGTGWTFTPNTGQKFSLPDASYAEYGWWVDQRTTGITVGSDPRVGAWYASGDGTALGDVNISAATGSATYTGTAIGKAALYHRLGGDQNIGGAFTADAELMATFGASPMLGGTIDNFDIGGMQPDWVVKLNRTPLSATTGALEPDGTTPENTTVWAIDGTDGDAGNSWTARLYDIPSGSHQPVGVAGGFQASYESDGNMIGAFGAEQ